MDQAKGILAYIQAKHPDKGYTVDSFMSELLIYDRRPEDQFIEVRETVSQIVKIIGKTARTMFNVVSLLKLFPEIQAAIQAGTLPISQGYLFAANLECPDLMKAVNS